MDVLEKFNKIMEEFIVKMLNNFPEEKKLKTYYHAFKMSRMYNSALPVEIFMGGCLDFTTQIKSRDANFFINRQSFVDTCVRASSFASDIGLKERWNTVPENTKKAIWDYIQTLYVLGEIYINKNDALIERINNIYSSMSLNEMKRFENDDVTDFSDDFKLKIK